MVNNIREFEIKLEHVVDRRVMQTLCTEEFVNPVASLTDVIL